MSQPSLVDQARTLDGNPPDGTDEIAVGGGRPARYVAVYALITGILITAAARWAARLVAAGGAAPGWVTATEITVVVVCTVIAGCACAFLVSRLRRR